MAAEALVPTKACSGRGLVTDPLPERVWDEGEQRLVSDTVVAEESFTAFTSHRKATHIGGRLIVRGVRRLNLKSVSDG